MFTEFMNKTVGQQFRLKSQKGMFGVEIETEGHGLPAGAITKYFVGKPDGSLRDGMEYVSGVLNRETVYEHVNELRNVLTAVGARINPSYRSSTHIHLNVIDNTFRDVLGMLVMWALIEPIVFRLMPPGRDGSLFCVSSYDSGDAADFTERFCSEISGNFINGFTPRGKYSSLNLTRLGPSDHHALGTLEYRVFPTTMDGVQIQTWCEWLFQMKRQVEGAKDDSFLTLVRYAEQNPVPFLRGIFGELPIPEGEAGDYVDFGARTAYEIARIIDRHLKIVKKVSQKSEVKKGRGLFQGRPEEMFLLDDIIPNVPQIAQEDAPAVPAADFQRARAGLVQAIAATARLEARRVARADARENARRAIAAARGE